MKKTTIFLLAIFGLLLSLASYSAELQPISAKPFTLSGIVTDSTTNSPLAGIKITNTNQQSSTSTNSKGYYSLPNTVIGNILIVEYNGRIIKKVEVHSKQLNIKLADYATNQSMDIIAIEERPVAMVAMEQAYSGTYATSPMVKTRALSYAMPITNQTESYNSYKENRFKEVSKEPLSTFALEVDGASYSEFRRKINAGTPIEKDAIRVEEFLNYFSYNLPKPTNGDAVKISSEVGECAWNKDHKLVRIGIKAKEIDSKNIPNSNFVFLIDVSGSMYTMLPLVKSSIKLLTNNLREGDRVAIVTYASSSGLVLGSTSGSDKTKIKDAIDNLTAGGSTAGGEGIRLAYKTARQNFISGGNNRIILCTDGDFNVGESSNEALTTLIETERKSSNIFLTVLGYGMGNYQDSFMQTLAEKGNGNYGYIDNMQEANKLLIEEYGSSMYNVAKDTKLQVEFNPSKVAAYRLVGYESRLLNNEDFNDDTIDAGEIGAAHTVTALYEIVPVGVKLPSNVDPLKYQQTKKTEMVATNIGNSPELMNIKLRYKEPNGNSSKLIEQAVLETSTPNSADYYFASSVAMFAQLLKNSDFRGTATYKQAIELAKKGLGEDEKGYRAEFIKLVSLSEAQN